MMRNTLFLLLGLLLGLPATSFCFGDTFCTPCDPCERVGNKKSGWTFDIFGWAETGIYTNSHGWQSNGPMHTKGNERTDFHLDQLYLAGDLGYETRSGFKFGGRMDLVYGVDARGMQSNSDQSFDDKWGLNRHDYALAVYQLFGTVAYENLSVKIGKFITPIGWEGSASRNNFFYSHSYCYWIEPSTHTGVLADYALNKRLTLSAGWTTGENASFQNRYNDNAALVGLTYKLSKNATLYYWMMVGEAKNGFHDGQWRFGDSTWKRQEYYNQSICVEWAVTDRFTYVMQYNLRNDTMVEKGVPKRDYHSSSYGINNHFLYKLNDHWGVGARLEWLRDNGGYFVEEKANYFQMTFGVNWNPNDQWSFRPEIRYDSVLDGPARPFGDNRRDQFSGGIGILYIF